MSLRFRLLLLVALAIIPALCIEVYGEIQLRAARQNEIRQDAQRLLRQVSAEQERIDEGARQLLIALAESRTVRSQDWAACSAMAERIRARVEGYVNIGIASAGGDLLCSALPIPPGRDMKRRSFLDGMTRGDGDLLVGKYHIGIITGQRVLMLAIPLRGAGNAIEAVAWANLDLDWLARHFADRFPSPNMTLLMADPAGTILMRLPDNAAWAGKPIGDAYMPMIRGPDAGIVDISGIDGEERMIAYSPVTQAPHGIYIGLGLSKAPYFAAIDSASWQKAVLISASFLLALAAAWLVGRAFIRRPVEALLVAARRWQEGDYGARAGDGGTRSEIGLLARAFNSMAAAVQGREQMRREAEQALAQLNAELEQRVKDEIAAREKAQAALIQAQKMDAVGQLTSGVAHDFNNLLAAAFGNLDLLRRRVEDERAQQLIDGAFRALDRGAKLTEQLLTFSRRRHIEPQPFDLNALIQGMNQLLAHSVGPMIVISRSLAADLWPVLADASQIEVALLNIAINARDAMPLGGTLLIETVNLPGGDERLPPELSGDFVMVAMNDTGTGMTEVVKARAFEPFYTTKEVGKGTGLGLSMVYGLVKQSGGTVVIESEPGKGTTVALFIPRSAVHAEPDAAIAAPPESAPRPRGRVLLIDDDSDVRAVIAAGLVETGFDLVAVENGNAALALMERDPRFDLLIVDYAMPGLNGAESIAGARRHQPNIPAILVTGYAEARLASDLPADVQLLRKPFRIAELVRRATAALASRPARPAQPISRPAAERPSANPVDD